MLIMTPLEPPTALQTPFKSPSIHAFRDTPSMDFSSGASTPAGDANVDDSPQAPSTRTDGKLASAIFDGSVTEGRKGHQRAASRGKQQPSAAMNSRPGAPFFRFGAGQTAAAAATGSGELILRSDMAAARPCKRKRVPSEQPDHVDWDSTPPHGSRPASADSPDKHPYDHSYFGTHPSYTSASPVPMPRAVVNFLHEHPQLPHILATWVQFTLNTLVAAVFAYVVWTLVGFVSAEIDHKAETAIQEARADIAVCARRLVENGCDRPGGVGPEFQRQCHAWAACAGRDAKQVGRATISATTMADIVNGFFEPLSWKFMVRTIRFSSCSVAFGDWAR